MKKIVTKLTVAMILISTTIPVFATEVLNTGDVLNESVITKEEQIESIMANERVTDEQHLRVVDVANTIFTLNFKCNQIINFNSESLYHLNYGTKEQEGTYFFNLYNNCTNEDRVYSKINNVLGDSKDYIYIPDKYFICAPVIQLNKQRSVCQITKIDLNTNITEILAEIETDMPCVYLNELSASKIIIHYPLSNRNILLKMQGATLTEVKLPNELQEISGGNVMLNSRANKALTTFYFTNYKSKDVVYKFDTKTSNFTSIVLEVPIKEKIVSIQNNFENDLLVMTSRDKNKYKAYIINKSKFK